MALGGILPSQSHGEGKCNAAYPMAVFCEGFSGTQTFIGPSSHGEGSIHAPALRMKMENITVLKEGLGDFKL